MAGSKIRGLACGGELGSAAYFGPMGKLNGAFPGCWGRTITATPDNAVDESEIADGLFVGVSGNVVAVSENGTVVTLTGLGPGIIVPIRVRRINATGTTVTVLLVYR